MSEIRKDIITGEWIIIAAERGRRPYDFQKKEVLAKSEICPFCPGNEALTPTEILRLEDEEDPLQWAVRIVPNKYPAVGKAEETEKKEEFYEATLGFGVHEVVIDTPCHTATIGTLSEKQIACSLLGIQKRYTDIVRDSRIQYVQIFKNQGDAAGASLQHPHWQIIGIPLIPPQSKRILEGARRYFEQHQKCVYCEMLRYEQQQSIRIIDQADKFIGFAPYASKYSYEMWIMPKSHIYHFGQLSGEDIKGLAHILKRVLHRFEILFPHKSYNVVFIGAPEQKGLEQLFHWHIQIIPRLGSLAGFELGTGCFINSVPPEVCAQSLKK